MQTKRVLRTLSFLGLGTLAIAALSGVPVGNCPFCWTGPNEAHAATDEPEIATITIPVKGMTCASCTVTVKVAVKKLKGVVNARVTLDPDQAVVSYRPNEVKPEQIVAAINEVGYKARLPKKSIKTGTQGES